MNRDIRELVSKMTLEEKAGMCSGADFWHTKAVERLGIPGVMMTDGPHGLRKQAEESDHLGLNEAVVAVCFPAACATASSYDRDLIRGMGEMIGEECQAEDISIILGPAVNIKRSPLCGRNFEYFSEDPYLAGEMAASYIEGVQSKDVGTSIKHFALNNQEYNRMSISSEVSERAMHEIYFPAFETAVKRSQPWTVMCSYNKLNGTYASDNEWLLTDVLRKMWGFEGYVMTDWGAVDDRVQGLWAGLELEMPASGGINDKKIVSAVRNGSLDEEVLDNAVEKILAAVFRYIDNRDAHKDAVFDRDRDHEEAVKIASECAVLLKNDGILPLPEGKKIAYIGGFADKPRYQGGGSSHINASKVVSAVSAAGEKGRQVTYTQGFPVDKDELTDEMLQEAVKAAVEADAAVIFAGLPEYIESEGYDRADMKLPECQNRLIEEVAKFQKNVVVVLHNGSPVETPWADDVAAVLEMYLAGQGVGEATDRILYGQVNPSGHLAESFPIRLEDNPSFLFFPGNRHEVKYAEDVFVGYRYYASGKHPVRWAFGHGLSYTSFRIDGIRLSSDSMDDESTVRVCVDVTNTGDRTGKEVVQLYIGDRTGTPERPEKELKGFEKVELAPGEKKTVEFTIDARSLAYWNSELGDWYAPSGRYAVMVGDASDNITAEASVEFKTAKLPPIIIDGSVTLGELAADPRTKPVYEEMLKKLKGRGGIFSAGEDEGNEAMGDAETTKQMMESMLEGMPLKSLASFSGGVLTVEELTEMFGNAVMLAE